MDGQGEIDEYLASALSRLLKPQPARARTARLAYGFHSPRALIALMKLKFGGVRIPLPFSYARKHS